MIFKTTYCGLLVDYKINLAIQDYYFHKNEVGGKHQFLARGKMLFF